MTERPKEDKEPKLPTRLESLAGKKGVVIRLTEPSTFQGDPLEYFTWLRDRASPVMPFAFWLSPRAILPVENHLEALRLLPDMFSLGRPPVTWEALNKAMDSVLRGGWMRGRLHPGGVLQILMWRPGSKEISALHRFVARQSAVVWKVGVETVEPRGWWELTREQFLKRIYPKAWKAQG